MDSTFVPLLGLWSTLALIVIALAIYRRTISSHEDDMLHVRDDDTKILAQQGVVAHKLEMIDKWGKTLTVVTVVIGVALGCYYTYWSFIEKSSSSANLPILR